MPKDALKAVISDFYERDLSGLQNREIELPIDSGKIVSVTGVRRAGKTSCLLNLARQLMEGGVKKEQILYLNFEDERFTLKQQELDEILQVYLEMFPEQELTKSYLFFDEIQVVNGWDKFVRRIYDNYTRNIFITGSNAKFLSSDIATSLRGRTITYEVFPLSFREHLNFKEIDFNNYSTRGQVIVTAELENYLFYGGGPETVSMKEDIRNRTLQEYFDIMIFKDLVERFNISNIPVLKFFIKKNIQFADVTGFY